MTATPIQPRIGERIAKAPPAPASQAPMEPVCPDRFITYARPSTAITVMIADFSSTYVLAVGAGHLGGGDLEQGGM